MERGGQDCREEAPDRFLSTENLGGALSILGEEGFLGLTGAVWRGPQA